jgi:hypothetical protein
MNTPPRHTHTRSAGPRVLSRPRRLPLPVSVTLYNFVPFSSKASLPHSSKKKWFHPEHSSSLLHAVRLQIISSVTVGQSDDGHDSGYDSGEKKGRKRERVIFSSIDTAKSVRPTWEHLNEYIEPQGNKTNLDVETYESLTMRFSIAEEGDDDVDKSNDHNHNHNTMESTRDNQDLAPTSVFLHLPIHPSKLVRIDSIPQNLPLNAVVLHFSDESIRVSPALFQVLTDSSELFPDPKDADAFDGRFDDSVFRHLDQVTPVKNTTSLLETDDESQATPVLPGFSSMDISATASDAVLSSHIDDNGKAKANTVDSTCCWSLTETASSVQDLAHERDLLERLIQEEQVALEQETADLQKSKAVLQEGAAKVQTMQDQTNNQVRQAVQEEDLEARRVDFLLQAQRIKLFRELCTIFPVTVSLEQRYFIVGLEIPSDVSLYAGTVSEEEVSASLGYLAHLVAMMSKYLAVQLRYLLYCNSSRSAIKDDRALAFPLFQGRTVEREQLEHGVRLLDRNVEYICTSRGIRLPAKSHVLAKVKRVYEFIIDGF